MDDLSVKQLAAEERKAYFKAWRAANKETAAEHRRRYWEKKALEKLNAAQEVKGDDATDRNDQ